MTYNWYQIFNIDEFNAEGLYSKQYEIELVGIGLKSIFVVKGFSYSIIYDNTMLTVNMAGNNPFEFNGYAIYLDEENNVWLGVPPA